MMRRGTAQGWRNLTVEDSCLIPTLPLRAVRTPLCLCPSAPRPSIQPRSPLRKPLRQLASFRRKREEPQAEPQSAPESAAAEPPQKSEAKAEDAAPLEEAPGETKEADPVVEEQPTVDPPRSWTKDAKEAFKLLPPALQERRCRTGTEPRSRDAPRSERGR
jgi:hypothetical protein